MFKLVVFDLDNTLIDADVVNELAKLVGKGDEDSEITRRAMAREIKFEKALKLRVRALKGLEIEKVYDAVNKLPLMKGAEESIKELKRHGIKTSVVTRSFGLVTDGIKNRLGLDYVVSNELVVKDNKITGEVRGPLVEERSKGKVLEVIAEKAGVALDECVAVCNGTDDVAMFEKVGLGIVFNSKPVLNGVADVVITKKDLEEILPPILEELNIDGLSRQREELQTKLAQMKREITKHRATLKKLGAKKWDLINAIKRKNSEANKHKKYRDRLNERVKEDKKKREKTNKIVGELISEYKKLKEKAPKGDFKRIEREINRLEWKLQTTVLEIKKEDELVEKIKKLTEELEGYKDLIDISKEIDKYRAESGKIHERILRFSEESQQHHERFLAAVEKMKELEKEIVEINRKGKEIAPALDKMNKAKNNLLGKLKKIDETIKSFEVRTKTRGAKKSERELKEKAKTAYDRFKQGEKLNLEDIYLLRRFNLV